MTDDLRYRDEEWLREKYAEYASVTPIAEECGVTPPTITRWMEHYGIARTLYGVGRPKEGQGQGQGEQRPPLDEETLRGLYEEHGSAQRVADACDLDVTYRTILNWLDHYDIDRPDPGEARWENVRTYTYEDYLDAMVAIHAQTGAWPGYYDYEERQPSWAPSTSTLYNNLDAFDDWSQGIADAKQHREDLMAGPVGNCLKALRYAADRLGHSPTVDEYQALGLSPSATTIAETCGSWNRAKQLAGLDVYDRAPREEYSRADFAAAIREVNERVDGVLTAPRYNAARDEGHPHAHAFEHRFEGFAAFRDDVLDG